MPLPLIAGVFLVRLHWNLQEDTRAVTNLHFRYSGGTPVQADLDAFATGIATPRDTRFRPMLANHYSTGPVDVIDLGSAIGLMGSAGGGGGGTSGSSGYTPASTSIVLNFKVNRRYRGGKPRAYMPMGMGSDLADAQTWSTSFMNNVVSAFNNFVTDVLAVTHGGISITHQCSVSYYQGGTWDVTVRPPKFFPTARSTPLIDDIVQVVARQHVGSQRRRLLH